MSRSRYQDASDFGFESASQVLWDWVLVKPWTEERGECHPRRAHRGRGEFAVGFRDLSGDRVRVAGVGLGLGGV